MTIFIPTRILSIHEDNIKKEYLYHLIHHFLVQHHFFKKTEMPLHSDILRKKYGWNYSKLLECLKSNNFIKLKKNYITGNRCNIYELTDDAKSDSIIKYKITNKNLLKKKQNSLSNEQLDDNYIWAIEQLYKFDINITDKHLSNYHSSVGWLCEILKEKELFYIVDSNGRLHTPFTIIKRQIRENFLSINNQPITKLDVPNSQPLFLYILLKEKYKIEPSWLLNFGKIVYDGKFYDILAEKINKSREESKLITFKILFGRNRHENKYIRIFRELFPEIWHFITEYKKNDHTKLANDLQKQESSWIFHEIIPQIRKENIPIFTVHDCIYFPISSKPKIVEIWDNSLETLRL